MTTQTNIQKLDIHLPNPVDAGKLAFILTNVFTKEECDQLIELSEKHGYGQALVNTGFSEQFMADFRNSDRCIIDNFDIAKKLFERIRTYLPQIWQGYELVGINERLRFLRYDPGHEFKTHMDGSYARSNGSGEQSFITIQLYLNEGFEGGETTFNHLSNSKEDVRCVPRTGMILIFEHRLWHEGSLLRKGRKYTIRTDVMYRPAQKK